MNFAEFWSLYPRKTAKLAAERAWNRLSPDEDLSSVIQQAIARQRKSEQWTCKGGAFVPHASTWLNGRRWEDELPACHGNDPACEAWAVVRLAVQQVGPYQRPEWKDARIPAVIAQMGGWYKLCEMRTADATKRGQEFEDLYRSTE